MIGTLHNHGKVKELLIAKAFLSNSAGPSVTGKEISVGAGKNGTFNHRKTSRIYKHDRSFERSRGN